MSSVYLSLGSNLEDRIKNIKKAINLIAKFSKIKKISSFYITQPMYYINQPYFINCVIEIITSIPPKNLLDKLLKIENKLGRKRTFKNSPRTIDIDIIYYDNKIIKTNYLKIPHPKRLERNFVMIPLYEINPKLKDPETSNLIQDEIKNLKSNYIIKLPTDYNEIIEFLSSLKPRAKKDFNTLYIKKSLKLLGNPQNKLKNIIHITGSVAKTSTALYIEKILRKYGFSTACYISPHIEDIRERITINGKMISKKEFTDIFIDIISKSAYIHSVFEYLTIIAIKYFSYKNPQFSIIEVGMGGSNDATNIFKKTKAVFTKITLEHKKFLGKTIKEITKNKAGIIKKKSDVFVSSLNNKIVIDTLEKICKSKNAKLYISPNFGKIDTIKYNFNFSKWVIENVLDKNLNCSFFPLKLKARKQIIFYKGRKILLDGAHTPISIKMLLLNIDDNEFKTCLCSFMKDKNYKRCIKIILEKNFKNIIITKSLSPRTFEPEKLEIDDKRILIEKDLKLALIKAIRKGNVVICGSLYLCGDIISILKNKKNIHLNELI
ncbi:MAG: 2-amino-4-hydroxy-6-hydroxymethyldihydropteridine diphosphokinase [Elusimicrobiales bacterium]|nr:2-amino-4-hydroxy-6-hydroxymethyldihydropteridine diphosphokinase [Elusimicrobiales bacterium]